jgi:hypothetical protein
MCWGDGEEGRNPHRVWAVRRRATARRAPAAHAPPPLAYAPAARRAPRAARAPQVHTQGEAVARIDDNVDETLGHVDAARGELMRYLRHVTSSRGLMLKVLLVILAFLAAFVLFVA